MPGFFCVISNNTTMESANPNNKNTISINNLFAKQCTIDKFNADKVFMQDANFFVLIEGVILNKIVLIKKYEQKTFMKTLIKMYEINGDEFFDEFRGSFSGVFYDIYNDRKLIFTSHIGDKQVFYSSNRCGLLISSEINYLIDHMRNENINYTLNKDSAYCLLTYGFMIEDATMFNEILKLRPGSYILIERSKFTIKQYYQIDNSPNYNQKLDDIIENVDFLFRQAIKRAFDKDREYGYKHLVALSGGLDSRMTTWVANDMGYGHNIVNCTYSQSTYLDETIPKQIARDLKHEWIFKSLDNGLFLKNIEDVVKLNAGSSFYYGLSHVKNFMDIIDKKKFGMLHSGQLGDVILGTYSCSPRYKKKTIMDGAISTKLSKNISDSLFKRRYNNQELFKLYERGFNGINQGLLVPQCTNETYSPFMDVDFINYCMSIPLKLRYNHYIYHKWMLEKYPKATQYKWERINAKITDKKISIHGSDLYIRNIPNQVLVTCLDNMNIKKNKSKIETVNHMNPFDYWYKSNHNLKVFLDNYYEVNIDNVEDYALRKACQHLYLKGNVREKLLTLTLLSSLKLYFG